MQYLVRKGFVVELPRGVWLGGTPVDLSAEEAEANAGKIEEYAEANVSVALLPVEAPAPAPEPAAAPSHRSRKPAPTE